ncbi:MAG: glycoside hydrolase family 31 protein [Kiritimatiellae bacterium]|nr:glycoside hydrolase family 31 protein [Kiritimatiellia bacterium]
MARENMTGTHIKLMAALGGACVALGLFGVEVRTEKLGDDLWRVRMSRDGKWTESALNRYGIIERLKPVETGSYLDFGVVKAEARQVGKGFELRFPLAKGDRVYGLGDVSRKSLNRRGDSYEIWVKNIYSYIPVPMMMTSSGWGVLVNTTFRHTFDVGKTDPDAVVVTAKEGEVDFYVFKGRDYRAMLDTYTRLTGRPALLPAFAFGFAYVANENIDSFDLTSEAFEFRRQKLPCDIIGLEPGWMEYRYDFTTKKSWNKGRFKFPYWIKPADHRRTWIGALENMGFKLSLWLCNNYDVFWFEEQCAAGLARPTSKRSDTRSDRESEVFFDKRVEGDFSGQEQERMDARLLEAEVGNARIQSVGRPDKLMGKDQDASKEAWFEHLKKFVDRGARCFKLDASQQVHEFPGRVYAGKLSHDEAHNMYSVVYDKQMAEGFEVYTGKRAMVYSAAGYTGLQRYVATWAGDTGGGQGPLISALNLGMSGHPNQSCDMNTFDIASVHFGVFAPWSQQNNWDYYHQIWFREEEKTNAIREYLNIRYRLFPYLYATAAEASRTGWPIMRPLPLVYPEAEEYADEAGTYLLGDSLLVSAFSSEVKIPEGVWYEWRTGEPVRGPCTLPVVKTDTWGGAVYVKAGAIVPMWPLKQHIDRGWNDKVELNVYLGADGAFDWYEDDGDSLAYRSGASATARVSLRGGVLEIGARQGSFDGMPEKHDITVVWHNCGMTATSELGAVRADERMVVSAPKDILPPPDSLAVCEYDALEKTARPKSMTVEEYCTGILRDRAAATRPGCVAGLQGSLPRRRSSSRSCGPTADWATRAQTATCTFPTTSWRRY